MNKYKILYHTATEFNGRTIYRIEAIKDFGDVKAGDLGGFVESELNLDDEGDCWIYDDAIVCNCAIVKDNAKVYNKAKIMDYARAVNESKIYGHAKLLDGAFVAEHAQVYGHALIELACVMGNAHVCGYAHCFGCANVFDDAEVYGNSVVTKNAVVSGEAIICGNSYIARCTITGAAKIKDKEIKNSKDYICR